MASLSPENTDFSDNLDWIYDTESDDEIDILELLKGIFLVLGDISFVLKSKDIPATVFLKLEFVRFENIYVSPCIYSIAFAPTQDLLKC